MIRFLFSLNIVWGIVCLLLYLFEGTDPQKFWIFSIASLIIPVSIILNLLIVFFWLMVHRSYAWLSAVILLVAFPQINKMLSWESESSDVRCRQAASFQLMSFNVFVLRNLKDTSDQTASRNKSQFLAFLRKNDPDVLCVQENNLFADEVISRSELFPYVHYVINHGAAIYSKYPILDQGLIDFGTNTNSCLWADILVQGRRARVYSYHLQSNSITRQVARLRDEEDEETARFSLVKQILYKYRKMSMRRAQQAELINRHVSESPYPCILSGDLNDTPFSFAYKTLAKDRKDSFLECGSGFGSTYVGLLPGLRIDVILADQRRLGFCFHRVLQTSYSDHNPVMTRVYFK